MPERTTLSLRHGRTEIERDPEARTLRIRVLRRAPLGLTRHGLRSFRKGAVAAFAFALLASSVLPPGVLFAALGVLALALVLEGLGRAARLDVRHVPDLVVDAGERTISVGDDRVSLGHVTIGVNEHEWTLHPPGGEPLPIGDSWGGPGASWLREVLERADRGELELPEAPGPERRTPGVSKLDAAPVFVPDHDGVVAERSAQVLPLQLLLLLAIGAATFAVFVLPGASPLTLWPWMAVLPVIYVAATVALMVHRWRGPHRFVRLDTRALRYTDSGGAHEVPLAHVVAVHLAPDAVQVDLREGPSLTLGHGWPPESLRDLHRRLSQAVDELHPPEPGSTDDVPEALGALRRASARQADG